MNAYKKGGHKAMLPYKSTNMGSLDYEKKSYRSSSKDCKHCPLRKTCIGKTADYKKIEDSIHKHYYDKMPAPANQLCQRHEKTSQQYCRTCIRYINQLHRYA
ncbi:MAG: hypothetical protein IPJ79_20285 [Bacteroidetes bacterium]|nr:hypothetical protein [Bacteroidota bacterium]